MKDNNAIFFCFPMTYGLSTRAGALVQRITFLANIVLPVFANSLFASSYKMNVIDFLLAFSAMYSIYEVGYIYNDVLTVRFEANPTIRLDRARSAWVANNYEIIIGIRVVWATLCCIYFSYKDSCNIRIFVFMLSLLILAYSFHNRFRDKRTAIANAFLQAIKYTCIVLLFGEGDNAIKYAIAIFIECAFLRVVEYPVMKGYAFKFLSKINLDIRRIVYYVFLLIFALVYYYHNMDYTIICVNLFLLLFRIASYIASKLKFIKKYSQRKE